MQPDTARMPRQKGVALWRQISDRLRAEIADSTLHVDGKLPTEAELAAAFSVNRHTIRAALSALASEGIVRTEQGRGTFIVRRERFTYPIGLRTRFSAALDGQTPQARTRIAGHREETAPAAAARALALPPASRVIRVETVGDADGEPITCATHWFDARRFAGIGEAIMAHGSITRALREAGVDDYTRRETLIDASHASPEDLHVLKLAPGAIVFVTTAINIDPDGKPIQYSLARFAADRVSLKVGG
ncbi:MAG: phosphonate metabolism transcriptional regulator PhnF [Phyllobacteriaceae bacterium]|nr:phosphonate metabolism transcriptional regulator PhnF [Phyllobacteriaceae bacterium]MBA90590.1 phosphonate metabolism transcriptional regulator PhnF [Phyllobacteriaceae bacterium]